jgi:transposase
MTSTERHVTGGVDTHADVHVAAVADSTTAAHLDTASFPTTLSGYVSLLAWLAGFGNLDRVGVESTGSWGAGLARFLTGEGVEVIEVDRPDRKTRRLEGKSDPIDAQAAARAVISGRSRAIPKSHDGLVEAIRCLEVVHHSAVKDRTRATNQFKALLVTSPESLRSSLRSLSFSAQLQRARRFGDHPQPVEREVRLALKELSRRISFLDDQTARIEVRIGELAAQASPALIGLCGVGPHVAAQLLATAGDNAERMHSEAAFAMLCAACPIPASSGKTTRHRLNRGGDRRANNALFTIVLVRMRHDPATRAYVKRRTAEGKGRMEIMRCLKRYVAREVYQALTNPPEDLPTGAELLALRQDQGLTQGAVCNALGATPIRLSRVERGLVHDTRLARRARTWLLEQATPALSQVVEG